MNATDAIAIYAAVVATFVLIWDIYKWKTAGPKIIYTLQSGMQTINMPEYDGRTLVTCTATNTGDRSTTITNWGYLYFDGWWSWIRGKNSRAAIMAMPSRGQPIPYELKPGTIWHGFSFQDADVEKMTAEGRLYFVLYTSHAAKGFSRRVIIRAKSQSSKEHAHD